MANTHDASAGETALQFGEDSAAGMSAIWSCKFSADGNEVFAGGSGPIYGMRRGLLSRGSADSWLPVYDLIADRRSMRIRRAHSNDVNSVCWADTASGNGLISGSDDGFVKVW